MQHLICWTGLDDATFENSCLQYILKSHKWWCLEARELVCNMEGLLNYLSDEEKNLTR